MYKLPKFGRQISVKVHVGLKDDPVRDEQAGKGVSATGLRR